MRPQRRSGSDVALSEGQRTALHQLRRIADTDRSPVRIIGVDEGAVPGAPLDVHITLDCSRHEHVEGGLRLHDREGITLSVPAEFPFNPPQPFTAHTRFHGFAHVHWGTGCASTFLRKPSGTRPRACSDSSRSSTNGYDAAHATSSIIPKGRCIPPSPTPSPPQPSA